MKLNTLNTHAEEPKTEELPKGLTNLGKQITKSYEGRSLHIKEFIPYYALMLTISRTFEYDGAIYVMNKFFNVNVQRLEDLFGDTFLRVTKITEEDLNGVLDRTSIINALQLDIEEMKTLNQWIEFWQGSLDLSSNKEGQMQLDVFLEVFSVIYDKLIKHPELLDRIDSGSVSAIYSLILLGPEAFSAVSRIDKVLIDVIVDVSTVINNLETEIIAMEAKRKIKESDAFLKTSQSLVSGEKEQVKTNQLKFEE